MKGIKFVSIRFKIIPLIAIIIFGVVVGLSVINYSSTKKQVLSRLTESELPIYMSNVENAIKADFAESKMIADLIAHNTILIDMMANSEYNEASLQKYLVNLTNIYGYKLGIIVDQNKAYFNTSGLSRFLNPGVDTWYFEFCDSELDKRLNIDWELSTQELKLFTNQKIYTEDSLFVGVVFVGRDITEVADFILDQKIGENGSVLMFDKAGDIRLHADSELIGASSEEEKVNINTIAGLTEIEENLFISNNEVYNYQNKSGDNRFVISKYIPQIGWYLLIDVSENDMLGSYQKTLRTNIGLALMITFAIFILSSVFLNHMILHPLSKLTQLLYEFGKGKLTSNIQLNRNDEIGLMSDTIQEVIEGRKAISDFTNEIGRGNLGAIYTPLSNEDVLGHSILEMREDLRKAKEDQAQREEENKQRQWAAEGVELINDILRKREIGLEELSFELLSKLIRYTQMAQGSFYILNDTDENDQCLEQTANYATHDEGLERHRIELGEGLVGRCYIEKKVIVEEDFPDNYFKLSSGLGEVTPAYLVLVPFIYSNNTYGVLELASVEKPAAYQLEFIEGIGEGIAAAISSIKSNDHTKQLLEQTNIQKEELTAQEEEMRQNLEEMLATQEEANRREEDLSERIKELETQLKEKG